MVGPSGLLIEETRENTWKEPAEISRVTKRVMSLKDLHTGGVATRYAHLYTGDEESTTRC